MKARVFADLNPRYPAKGERRWAIFRRYGCELEILPRSFTARRSAERHACQLQVEASLAELGIIVAEKTRPS